MKNVVLGNNLMDLYTLEDNEFVIIRRVRDEIANRYFTLADDLIKIIDNSDSSNLNNYIASYCYQCKEYIRNTLEFLEINFNRLTNDYPHLYDKDVHDKYVDGIKNLIEDYIIPDINFAETMCLSYDFDKAELEEIRYFEHLLCRFSRDHWSSFEKGLFKVIFPDVFKK